MTPTDQKNASAAGTHSAPRGVWVAALTPLTADLAPDTDRLIAHCRWLLGRGANGLAVLGTTGEANSLSVSDKLALMDAMAEAGLPGSALLPGTGTCSLADTVALTRKAVEIGAAGVIMLPPFYYKGVSDEGLYASYSEVVQRVGDSRLKVYFYHFPQQSATPISHDLMARLIEVFPDTMAGIKDSSGNLDNMVAMCRRFPGFGVFAGSEQFLLPVLRAGGVGCISASANVTVSACADLLRAHDAGDAAATDAAQERITAWRLALQSEPMIAGLKALIAGRRNAPDWNRLLPPNLPLDAAGHGRLVAALEAVGFPFDELAEQAA